MKLSETAEQVIRLGEAIRNYWDAELPKRHRDYPFVHPGEDSGPPPPEEKELNDLLSSLPDDELYKLLLIMHLGRGDFGMDDLQAHYEALKERWETPEWAAAMMTQKPSLPYYLTDGLAKLKKSGIDIDHLTLAAVS